MQRISHSQLVFTGILHRSQTVPLYLGEIVRGCWKGKKQPVLTCTPFGVIQNVSVPVSPLPGKALYGRQLWCPEKSTASITLTGLTIF